MRRTILRSSAARSVWLSIVAAVAGSAVLGLGGCGMESGPPVAPPTTIAGSGLTGGVHGGQQPVSGAKVYLYAASTFTNAGSATPLLKAPGYVLTDSMGNFNITADYTCPAGTYVYLLALGGNPGLGGADNPELALGAGLGACSSLTPTSFYTVNEATTVAVAYSLTNLATAETHLGAPSAAVLGSAFSNINNLVDPDSGSVRTMTPTGNGTVPQARIDTLADALASCVNSDGTGSPCSKLMTAAGVTSGGGTPVDTFQAILNIAKNPSRNVAAIYDLSSPSGPFQPTLFPAPTDWTLTIQYPSPVVIDVSQATATIVQSGQQEFSATVKGGTTGSYRWTVTATAGLLSEVGGAGQTGKATYCSTSPVTSYVSSLTPVLTKTAQDTITVQAYSGSGCMPSNLLASNMATVDVVHAYSTVVVFGDSFSDTGNLANVTTADFGITYPGPDFNYATGRLTDDTSTTPAATLYTGLYVDQLAATLPSSPAVQDSLDMGTNYAYADATTADGTTTVTLPGTLTLTVNNMGQQVTDYLATSPVITDDTLFIVWGGTDELTNSSNTPASETAAAAREVALVQRLIDAGATDIVVPNVPPLGTFPAYAGTGNVDAETQAAETFNQALSSGLAGLPGVNPTKTLHLLPLDVFSLFTATIGPPLGAGFTDVVDSAQGASVNPDTFLFWDEVHLTTAGNQLLSTAAASVIAPQ